MRAFSVYLVVLALFAGRADADVEPAVPSTAPPAVDAARAPPPNPARGEDYDGRKPRRRWHAALWVPKILLYPFRVLFWGLEPAMKPGVEFEQRHHVYTHLYEAFTWDNGQVGLRPAFQWVSSFRPSFGMHLFDHRMFGSGTRLALDLGGGVDVGYVALHLRPTHIGRRVQAFLDTLFDHRNDWRYTGIGAAAPPLPGQLPAGRYLANRLDIAARVDLHALQSLAFSFGGFFGFRRFGNGESYSGDRPIDQVYCVRGPDGNCVPGTVSDLLVPGFNSGTQFLRASAAMHVDLRDDLIRPTLGALIDAQADYTHGVGFDESSYFRLRGAVTFDISLWGGGSHVLVLRGATEVVAPLGNSIVPFSELSTLGGPETLRGFKVDAFRDFSSLLATAEYRWPIVVWVDASLFVDYGGVFGKWYDGIDTKRMQPDVGFAFRLRSRDRFYIKAQFAYGFNNGWQIYLTGQNLP